MTPRSTWDDSHGVIELPNGIRIRGRGLRRPFPDGARPAFGLYLLGREPPAVEWASRWVVWPDFRLPRDRSDAVDALVETYTRASRERVEVACGGGRGRTGTALACMATLAGVAPREAVHYVRARYDKHAVETPFQRWFVHAFARHVPPR
jgi:hypothetical protein